MANLISEYLQNHKLYKLLYRIANQDPDALEDLFNDYGQFIYWHIMSYVRDKDIGEDILQEVFLRLYVLEPKNVPSRGATSWLIRVIHNTTIAYLEKLSHKTEKGQFYSDLNRDAEILSISSAEDEVISAIYVDELLRSFDPETHEILHLRYQGYTFDEISQTLDIKSSTARSKYSRAIQQLRKIM